MTITAKKYNMLFPNVFNQFDFLAKIVDLLFFSLNMIFN